MPVTARLSSRFYEKFGDEATSELVNWLNDVDAEFRNQLRESNDRNWDRFRAELSSGLADLRSELRIEIERLRTEMRAGIEQLRTELHAGIGGLRAELHKELTIQLRWMFAFWVTTLIAIAGLKLL